MVLGGLSGSFGLIGVAIELSKLLDGTAESPVFGFAMATFFVVSGAALLYLGRRLAKGQATSGAGPDEAGLGSLEPRVFRVAADHQGRLSPGELSADLGLPYDVAREALASLAARDACQVMVTEDGATLYRFPELEGPEHRRDLLEP